jgi:hypothetical protein
MNYLNVFIRTKGHQKDLLKAIEMVGKMYGEIDTEAEKVKKEINETCDDLKKAVEDKRGELTKEVERIQGEKKLELINQRKQLSTLNTGIQESTIFAEVLLKEGTETEIAASQKMVLKRLKGK